MTINIPTEAFPPGEFLKDELEARGWTQLEFSKIIKRPKKLVSDVINGKSGISPDTALDFAAALGTSAQSWLNLETSYQLFKASLEKRSDRDEEINRRAKLHEKFAVSEMIKRSWIEDSESFEILETQVLGFFGIDSINDPIDLKSAAKRDYSAEVSPRQLAWLYRVKQVAESSAVPAYSQKKLKAALADLELLTSAPEEIRKVPSILSSCGVRFVVVEPMPGSKICGVCFWVDENKSPVIGITTLYDRIDNFWFVLRHELEHVLRGDGKQEIIIDEPNDSGGLGSEHGSNCAEEQANKAAQSFCVPVDQFENFYARLYPVFSNAAVLGFAKRIERHPGIVVGQLQRRANKYSLLRKYLVKVRHIIIGTALTDGFGVRSIH